MKSETGVKCVFCAFGVHASPASSRNGRGKWTCEKPKRRGAAWRKPANLNTVKFKCAGGRSFRVEVDEDGEGTDGLRFIPSGIVIIVK